MQCMDLHWILDENQGKNYKDIWDNPENLCMDSILDDVTELILFSGEVMVLIE